MTRVLLTYANAAERRLVARRACRLAARGVDVALATTAAAARIPAAAYDRVIDAASCEPIPAGARDHEGSVSIAGADPDRALRARTPAAERPPPRRRDLLLALVSGAGAAVGLTTLALPLFYPLAVGLLVALATLAVLTELHAPPLAAQTPSGSNPLARCG